MVVDEGRGGKDDHLTKSLQLLEPSANVEGAVSHDTGVLDVALASKPRGVISRNSICGLLNECLQDVSSAILAMLCLFVRLLCFLFFSICVVDYEIN
jgi:hypothetical protein